MVVFLVFPAFYFQGFSYFLAVGAAGCFILASLVSSVVLRNYSHGAQYLAMASLATLLVNMMLFLAGGRDYVLEGMMCTIPLVWAMVFCACVFSIAKFDPSVYYWVIPIFTLASEVLLVTVTCK